MTMINSTCAQCNALHELVRTLQYENETLRQQLAQLQSSGAHTTTPQQEQVDSSNSPCIEQHNAVIKDDDDAHSNSHGETYSPLTLTELQRYGRQMLVKELGVERQLALRRARVLVLGVGGLGSPVAMYLAAMGVGCLGLVDDDIVERSNLHRQVIHDESTLHELKVVSAQRRIAQLNPDVRVVPHALRLTAANALALVTQYDVVVDASDNVATRYVANDACVRAHKPLVSGSALGLEGQVTVFAIGGDGASASGCYRCLYPTPQPSAAAMSCSENGVIGVVPGVIGCLQAMETVKVLTGLGKPLVGVQCFYDAFDGSFRRLTLRVGRSADCSVCSPNATSSSRAPQASLPLQTCSQSQTVVPAAALLPANRMSVLRFHALRCSLSASERSIRYTLLDTRTRVQFDMVHFPEALHVPFATLAQWHQRGELRDRVRALTTSQPAQLLVICRRGVDSVAVTQWLLATSSDDSVANIDGGYEAFAQHADPLFPMY